MKQVYMIFGVDLLILLALAIVILNFWGTY
jgi:hypothetical protein